MDKIPAPDIVFDLRSWLYGAARAEFYGVSSSEVPAPIAAVPDESVGDSHATYGFRE